MSNCIHIVTMRKLAADGNPIKDLQGNKLTEEVKLITNADRFDVKNELQKLRIKIMEEEYRKFESNKKVCFGAGKLQMCPGVHATLDTVPKYADVKKNRDLISTLEILQSICYANKDGGSTFKPYKNIKIRKRHLSHTMNKNKSACAYKEDIKINFESSLSIAGHFLFNTCNLEYQSGKTWKDYLKINGDNQEKLEKEANELDKSMMFVFGCENNGMQDNLKQMSVYNNEKYPQIIKAACNIY